MLPPNIRLQREDIVRKNIEQRNKNKKKKRPRKNWTIPREGGRDRRKNKDEEPGYEPQLAKRVSSREKKPVNLGMLGYVENEPATVAAASKIIKRTTNSSAQRTNQVLMDVKKKVEEVFKQLKSHPHIMPFLTNDIEPNLFTIEQQKYKNTYNIGLEIRKMFSEGFKKFSNDQAKYAQIM